ncbi:MAG TPA: nuclease A inhibitor family protein, partial [Pyrinomonadaceae bacterium]|nr:nuclease A inhibitor family protein [Pyrinomonadaceae bacterium]
MRKSKKNLPGPPLVGNELFKSIGEACEGLIYISETDAPVLPFVLGDDTTKDDIVLEKLGSKAAHSVETYSLEEFFNRLTKKREWFGPAEIAMADKFAR